MDLIVELIKAIVEAFENRKKPTIEPAPAEPSHDDSRAIYEAQQRVLAKQEAVNRQRELAAESRAAAEDMQRAKAEEAAAIAAAAARAARPATGPRRLARLLRQPATVREIYILGELLGPPKALRRGRR